ncbi:MarR family transcriptional regulator [Tessaracoccus sp. MC1627]|uniref:MarR family winged helix-turn-helix transcriptional regulator n=1 Tax=Tessaracoccus sp. MC1627 TaxID=2760312 RepID=UPI001601BF97|nr:MarR family transcriptional regulator [Tessaracoccus sp. MC1627]MBB1513869.1 MarR family transcriptional regulator [Tessaracoccus sp. MC1627]
MGAPHRMALVGSAVEELVMWSRTLDGHRRVPFGDLQLSRAQLEVLFLIVHSDGPATPGAVADRLGVTPAAVTQLVAGLVDLGLVRQDRDPADGRRRVLVLEPERQLEVAGFEREVVERMAPHFAGLDDDELRTLVALLGRSSGSPS